MHEVEYIAVALLHSLKPSIPEDSIPYTTHTHTKNSWFRRKPGPHSPSSALVKQYSPAHYEPTTTPIVVADKDANYR